MRKYCKAYYLKDLRQFSSWTENLGENGAELSDDSICYIGDDYVVVRNPIEDHEPVFEQVTPDWQEFCAKILHFEIPEDLRVAHAAVEAAHA